MKLHLFTSNYPYGFGESFINNELPYLIKEFDQVLIYPVEEKGEIQSSFDTSAKVVSDANKLDRKLSFGDKLYIFRIFMKEFFHVKQRWFLLKKSRRFYATLKKGVKLAHWLNAQEIAKTDVHYSFWMNEWALALAIAKHRHGGANFVFRVNGFDIHNERHEGNYLPFRYFIYTQVSRVIPLSKTSRDYIRDLGMFPEKIEHAYFGTKDLGEAKPQERDEYLIFTCSTVIPLKRIPKIAESICRLTFPIKWVHHGDGPELEKVQQMMSEAGDNIEFVNTQRIPNYYQVLEMERDLCPDLFINLSTSEGLPVSVMEALSFGIPVLLNDVGSCKEFVTELTGVLVSPDESTESIAKEIEKLWTSKKSQNDRSAIRKFWFENFSAEKNYSYFAKQLREQN